MPTTKWTCNVDANGTATLLCQITEDGGQPGTPFSTKLNGVCYSPAPLNGSNSYAPALGDWYWDSFGSVTGWKALWGRDWQSMNALNLSSLRVYCMLSRQLNLDGTFPNPWNAGQFFTHQNFLDLCWDTTAPDPQSRRTKFALVGIPLPSQMFWKEQYDKTSKVEIDYWTGVLQETAQSVGRHPGVMGFTIQNEQDGSKVCYEDPVLAQFWWGQVEKMAAIVKQAAPNKLVGMATHDDPKIPRLAAAYMANCPHIDFWGVNSYQTQTFGPFFADYGNLKGGALKPVILTEWGMPATTRKIASEPASIYDDATSRAKAAAVVNLVVPQAYKHPLCIGLYYFEFCDEWWNQPGAPNIYTWFGGQEASGFPNGYWDNDGFGLYSIRRGGNLPNNAPIWSQNGNGPAMPIDVHTERTELTSVLTEIFQAATASK